MAHQGIIDAVSSCLDSGDHSDLTIKCENNEFKAHKVVLCPQSTFFAKALKKNAFQEGQTGVISMDADDPDAIHAMLRFLYTGDYSNENLTMQSHLKIYELADKVDVSSLKTLCEEKFKGIAGVDWKDATFPACIKLAYDITPPGSSGERLRSIVVEIVSEHVKDLLGLDTGFMIMMKGVPDFAADVVEALSAKAAQNGDQSQIPCVCKSDIGHTFTIPRSADPARFCPICGYSARAAQNESQSQVPGVCGRGHIFTVSRGAGTVQFCPICGTLAN
ncbi:hypothetical protein FKW77_006690 [Venturia effusa]|uniref:BTB domain-containing protein n=1 Tax=Venturia effusa TaxID=50376 RepID=A0A517L1J2_9PEZI|nr:hypothetical protein FKW77_006690 [Venturia effusa]